MQILIVKMSSLGDVIHALPAVYELKNNYPNAQIDWVVEASLLPIVKLASSVANVIPIKLRSWRHKINWAEIKSFYCNLRQKRYDLIIDSQGLFKSSLVAFLARGKRVGFAKDSAREPLSSLLLQQKISVEKNLPAIKRQQLLFAKIFNYQIAESIHYGLLTTNLPSYPLLGPYVIFLHGTTWESKLWPLNYWQQLGVELANKGYNIYLPWGNQEEKERALAIIGQNPKAYLLDALSLPIMASILAHAAVVIGVDTGLIHLAAALEVKTIALYGATDSRKTGVMGHKQYALQANFPCSPCLKRSCPLPAEQDITPPCFISITPNKVLELCG